MHIKCNNLNFLDYQYLNGNDDPWFCLKCNTELFPFGNLNNKTLNQYINSSNIQNKDIDEDNSSNLVLKPPPNLNSLFTQFNNSSQIHEFKDPKNVVNCKYYNLEEVQTMKIPNKKNSLSLFHINACSLSKNFDDLEYLLKTTNTNFNKIAISETRIPKNTRIVKNIDIPNYSGLPWHCKNLFQSRTNYLVITLIKKTFLRKLNFTLNIKVTETCYLP